MSKFQEGNKGKPKGAQNKVTKVIKEVIADLIDENNATFKEKLKKCSPYEYCRIHLELMKLITPRATELKVEDAVKFVIKRRDK